ncbi:MAG TPA: glycosyltransferase [Gemmatimonadales bacterium]|nr:glycosyltransferase [Gemmatimonadales bacterium]
MTPEVSVVVPTRNGIATLPALVEALAAQADAAPRELVVVDSGSTDGTAEYAAAVADHVVTIPPAEFNHGATRNLGLARASGRFVVLTVQDARPLSGDWLSRLLAPLRADERVAGTFARQVPRTGTTAVMCDQLARWVASREAPRVVALDPDTFATLPPLERLDRCAFDHVCAAIRRTAWEALPFRAAPIAEDLDWSRKALLAGHRIAYVPDAVVEHSHDRPARYELARTWALHQQLQHLFGLRAVPTPLALARSIAVTLAAHRRVLRAGGVPMTSAEGRRALALAVAWPLGQFLGGWTAAHGRPRWRPGGV